MSYQKQDDITVTSDDRELLAREIEAVMGHGDSGTMAENARSGQLLGYRKAVLQAIARARLGRPAAGPDPKLREMRRELGALQDRISDLLGRTA